MKCHNDSILSVEILPKEYYMATSSHDFCVYLWNLGDFTKVGVINMTNNFW